MDWVMWNISKLIWNWNKFFFFFFSSSLYCFGSNFLILSIPFLWSVCSDGLHETFTNSVDDIIMVYGTHQHTIHHFVWWWWWWFIDSSLVNENAYDDFRYENVCRSLQGIPILNSNIFFFLNKYLKLNLNRSLNLI